MFADEFSEMDGVNASDVNVSGVAVFDTGQVDGLEVALNDDIIFVYFAFISFGSLLNLLCIAALIRCRRSGK